MWVTASESCVTLKVSPGLRNDREEQFPNVHAISAFTNGECRLQKKAHLRKCAPAMFKRGRNWNPRGWGTRSMPPSKLMAEPQLELRSSDPWFTCHERTTSPGVWDLNPTPGCTTYCVSLQLSNPPAWWETVLLCLPLTLAVRVIDAKAFCQELYKCRVMLHLFA